MTGDNDNGSKSPKKKSTQELKKSGGGEVSTAPGEIENPASSEGSGESSASGGSQEGNSGESSGNSQEANSGEE